MASFEDLPSIIYLPDGREWWSVREAAQRWGVAPRRIYKWINGQLNQLKGHYVRKGTGERVPRYIYQSRVRLEPVIDYELVEIEGRRPVYAIRPQEYPAPNRDPMVRPEGIGQGEHRSHISYEANREGGYDSPETPFLDPYASPAQMVVPVSAEAGPRTELERRALPAEPEPVPAPELAPAAPARYGAADISYAARQMADMLKAVYAERSGTPIDQVTPAAIRAALRRTVAVNREQAIRMGEDPNEVPGGTAEGILEDRFDRLFQNVYGDPDFPWTRDPMIVVQVREAYLNLFRDSAGRLDGIPRKTRR